MLDDPSMPYFCPCNYDKIFPFHSLSNDDFIKLWPSKIKTVNINKIHYDLTQYCTLKTIAKISQSPKDFIILQINTRSLIKNFGKIEELLITSKITPDIIAICETKLKTNLSFPYSLNNYNFIHVNSPTNAGGVGMFIKSSYLFNKTNKFNLNLNACEDIWIEITLPNNKKVIIGTIYRHPNHKINSFLNELEKTMDKLNRNECTYYICGDINIDLKKNSSEILNYKNTLYSYGCKQYVLNNTHIVKDTPTSLLDHFYSNYEESTITSHILLSDISDHLPIITIVKNFRPLL